MCRLFFFRQQRFCPQHPIQKAFPAKAPRAPRRQAEFWRHFDALSRQMPQWMPFPFAPAKPRIRFLPPMLFSRFCHACARLPCIPWAGARAERLLQALSLESQQCPAGSRPQGACAIAIVGFQSWVLLICISAPQWMAALHILTENERRAHFFASCQSSAARAGHSAYGAAGKGAKISPCHPRCGGLWRQRTSQACAPGFGRARAGIQECRRRRTAHAAGKPGFNSFAEAKAAADSLG